MCHQSHDRPPPPPSRGGVADHGSLELEAADGNRARAYRASPTSWNGRNAIVLPDVRGLHPFYEAFTRRLAEAGFEAVAIDYYGRSAGTVARGANFSWRPHLPKVEVEHVAADAAAAAELLRREHPGPLFTVGFCFGGGHAWRLGASDLGLAGAVGFYGLPYLVEDVVHHLSAPMLMLLASDDNETPTDEYERLTHRLDAAGKTYEVHVFEGLPHSFFDRSSEAWGPACTEAWRRLLDFTERNGT